MASGKAKYLQEQAAAQKLGYANDYQRRKAAAQAKGYTSPRTQRKASEQKRGIKRDLKREYQTAKRTAADRGYRNPREQRVAKKLGLQGDALEVWQRDRILNYFGISISTFKRIRTANRAYSYAGHGWTRINTYDKELDSKVHLWSERRVGYIIAFHAAIVNPRTNWDSLPKDADSSGKVYRKENSKGEKITNTSQFYYLVMYTNIMQIDEFEARYGATVISEASKEKVTP